MPPSRSKSAKPGGIRLPGTFNAPPSTSPSPSPASAPRRSASAKPLTPTLSSTNSSTTRRLPGTSSVPASRLAAKQPSSATGSDSGGDGLLSSFGRDAVGGGSGRLDRAKSIPNVQSSNGGGQSRLERLGLNRASIRQRARSPSPEASDSEEAAARYVDERRKGTTPKPSWARGSSEEDEPRPNRTSRRSLSPTLTSSPPPKHRRSSRPPSPAASPSPPSSLIPPVQSQEENKPEEAKGTLFGNLWNKAATAWSGEATNVKEPPVEPSPAEPKEDPFRKTKRLEEENAQAKKPSTALREQPTLSSEPRRSQSLVEPLQAPVEPITYHRPPEIHPRNALLASTTTKYRHQDAYDWLGDQSKSPLDAYLFHRQAGRMATKKVRLKRPAPHGMAIAPAILAGSAFAGTTAHESESGTLSVSGSAMPRQAPNISPGVFVPQAPTGPVQAFSQAPRQNSAPAPAPHPGPPPVAPPLPPGYQPPTSSSHTGSSGLIGPASLFGTSALATSAPPAQISQISASQPPNPNALPSFPAPAPPTSLQPNGGPLVFSQPPTRSTVAPLPPMVSAAPAPNPYPYVAPAAPLGVPAPVFTTPSYGVPTSISTEAPLGDMFKTALAKKLFGTQLSDVPNPAAAVPHTGGSLVPAMYPLNPIQQAQLPGPHHPSEQRHGQVQPRLSTPAAPTEPLPTTSSPPTAKGDEKALLDHGVLPPMPIPQSIIPISEANATKSISFAPPMRSPGLTGWSLPAPPTSPLPTVPSSSPGPTISSFGKNAPESSTTPGPETLSEEEVRTQVVEDAQEADEHGEEDADNEEEDADLHTYASSTSQSPSSALPVLSLSPTFEGEGDRAGDSNASLTSLPAAAALATPLPPSPAPSSFLPERMPTSTSSPSLSGLTLPPIPSDSDASEEPLRPDSTSKELPPSPSVSPLPLSTDYQADLDLSLRPQPPALPPLPPSSPAPVVPPRPFSSASSRSFLQSPSSPLASSLVRAPSLTISIDTVSSPRNDNLEVASITLQPPTPIELAAVPLDTVASVHSGASNESEEQRLVHPSAVTDLTPLSLDFDLDSSPLSFNFDSLDFSTPSIVPDLPDTQSYFSSLGLDFGGGGETAGQTVAGKVERDEEGRLELPVLREENLLEEVESGDEADMADEFDATTSFVSGFMETNLARAKVDPGHTGRTEKWLVGQGLRAQENFDGLKRGVQTPVPQSVPQEVETSAIFRPRTAPPSSIPPSSLPPSQSFTRSLTPTLPSISTSYLSLGDGTLSALDEGTNEASSPIQTMINFDQPLSSLNRGRAISSSYGRNNGCLTVTKEKAQEEERRRLALGALSNQAFST